MTIIGIRRPPGFKPAGSRTSSSYLFRPSLQAESRNSNYALRSRKLRRKLRLVAMRTICTSDHTVIVLDTSPSPSRRSSSPRSRPDPLAPRCSGHGRRHTAHSGCPRDCILLQLYGLSSFNSTHQLSFRQVRRMTHSSRCRAISVSSSALLLKSRFARALARASKFFSLIEKNTPPSSAIISALQNCKIFTTHQASMDQQTLHTSYILQVSVDGIVSSLRCPRFEVRTTILVSTRSRSRP